MLLFLVPKALAGDRGVLQNIKLAKELYRVFSGAHMAECLFRGYETALRLHTPEATLASYPGLRGGAGIIHLKH